MHGEEEVSEEAYPAGHWYPGQNMQVCLFKNWQLHNSKNNTTATTEKKKNLKEAHFQHNPLQTNTMEEGLGVQYLKYLNLNNLPTSEWLEGKLTAEANNYMIKDPLNSTKHWNTYLQKRGYF